MSRSFAGTATDYLDRAGAVVTAVPLSIGCWFRTTSFSISQTLITLGVSGTENNRFALALNTSGSVRADIRDGSGSDTAFSASAISLNVWCYALAVYSATNARTAYANGGNAGTNTATRIPVGVNYTLIGKKPDNTNFFSGQIAQPTVWTAALTAEDAAALYSGVSPRAVNRAVIGSVYPWLGANEIDPLGQTSLTVHGTSVSTLEPPAGWIRGRRSYFFAQTTPTLGFDVAPAISATITTAYTISLTPSGSCTVYGVAVRRGDSAPSVSQVKAGQNAAGAAAKAANSKAITGADSLVLSGLTNPIHDLYFVLNSGGTDSMVAVIAGAFLSPATGKQFKTVTLGSTGKSVLEVWSVAANGDVIIIDTATDPDLFPVAPRANGEFVYAANRSTARQKVIADLYDVSADALLGEREFWSNNRTPAATPDSTDFPSTFSIGQVVDIDMSLVRKDPEGGTTTVDLVSGPGSVVANHFLWTATEGDFVWVFSFSDGLNSENASYSAQVLTLRAPSLLGLTVEAATTLLAGQGFSIGAVTMVNNSAAFGTITAQSPAADSIVETEQVFSISVSTGPIFVPGPVELKNRRPGSLRSFLTG